MEHKSSLAYLQERATGPVHTFPFYFPNTVSSNLRLGLLSGLSLSGFPFKMLYKFVIYHARATCPIYLILLDLTTLIIRGEAYRLWSSLYSVLLCEVYYV